MRKQITPFELFDAAAERLKGAMYHTMPGIVVTFYPGVAGTSPACVDVQPAVNDVRFDTDTTERISEPWPIIPRVPILYPKGGGYVMAFPLQAQDKVTLIAYDLDPTAHRLNGAQVDPMDVRRHAGAYWAAIPGDITNPGAMLSSTSACSSFVLGQDGRPPQQIVISATSIALGGSTDAIALASKVDAFIAAVMAWVPVPDDGGAALKTALTAAGYPTLSPKRLLVKTS